MTNLHVAAVLCTACMASFSAFAGQKYCAPNSGAIAVDVSEPVTDAFLDEMKRVGVSTVIRYYDYDPPTLPKKTLRRQEHDQIVSHGFNIAVVFQHHNDRLTSFTPERGRNDAERSLALAEENAQPKSGLIYFGVDNDWNTESELRNIRAYFQAVNDTLAPKNYRVGVYGSGRVCRDIIDKGLAQMCWLSQSTGFSDYQSYYLTQKWRLAQAMPENCGGINVDFNIPNGTDSNFGQFGQPE
jgi:hypothetical protein